MKYSLFWQYFTINGRKSGKKQWNELSPQQAARNSKLKHFALDLDAQTIALLTIVNRNTANRHVYLIRKRIAEMCEQSSPFQGEIEVDVSCFGVKRVKGKNGRGAHKKTIAFSIL